MRVQKTKIIEVRINDMVHLKQRIRDTAEMVSWVWQELEC